MLNYGDNAEWAYHGHNDEKLRHRERFIIIP